MRSRPCALFFSFLFQFLAISTRAQVAPRPLITQLVDESQLISLKGSTHPLARPQFDIGTAAPDTPMRRMLLILKRRPEQEHALIKLLDDQQDKASPNYHKWLTPDEFGQQFGPADSDLQVVTDWLQSHGFQVNRVTHGRSIIEFSGVESQIEEALHTQIHKYLVNGEEHWANASDPQIPAALTPVVAGLKALNNFPAVRHSRLGGVVTRDKSTGRITPSKPLFTLGGQCGIPNGCFGVGPYDFAKIYDVLAAWTATPAIDGTGETIAIVAETDINPQDVAAFRNFFGLPAYGQQGGPNLNIIHDGQAPGILTDGEETESDLDVEWSGAVAKGASVDFVVAGTTETSLGIDLSALHIVDNNLAPVMSESYGECELFLGSGGNQFFSALWQQAAAQGITVMLSAGDGSSAGCDDFNATGPATHGLAVSGYASTPFNVAVGGTDFNDLTNAATYWSTSNDPTTHASALSYIPETTWDDNCTNPVFGTLLGFSNNAETNCNNSQLINHGFINILGGSGGKSSCISSDGQNPGTCTGAYPKPSWQNAPGVASDGIRDVPDVSLFAAVNSPSGAFYLICESDQVTSGTSCNPNNPATNFLGIGGTSASSPSFAGIMALVNQQENTRQGNANFVLYNLARHSPSSFHDITTGTIEVPCQTNSPNCTTSRAGDQFGILNGYNASAGYDLATGVGSVDVDKLLQNWSSANFTATTTKLQLNPTTNLTHGQTVNVSASVAPSSGSGTPTGDVSLLTSTGVSAGGFTLNNGTISGSTTLLPGGTYKVMAHYAGDPTFGASDSSAVNVTVGKENSSVKLGLVTYDFQGNLVSLSTTSAVYGSPYLLRADVLDSAGNQCDSGTGPQFGCPTGSISFVDNGSPLSGAFALNSLGYTENPTLQLPGGNNSVTAQYTGDNSFNVSSATQTFAITRATTTAVGGFFCGCAVGADYSAYATVQAQSSGAIPTGTFTFYANGKAIPGALVYAWNRTGDTVLYQANLYSSSSPFPTPENYTLTASYSGDANYQPATSAGTTFFVRFDVPIVNLQSTPSAVNAGSSATLVATVLGGNATIPPTGTISFFEANAANLPGTVSYATIKDPNTGNLDLQGTLTITPGFTDGYFANYNGDSNYPPGNVCCATIVTVNGNDFVFNAKQSSATVTPGGTASYPLLVGFQSNTAPVSFTCSGLPSEANCSISPNPDSSTMSLNLGISTTASNAALATKGSSHSLRYLWLGSILPFAAILLIGYRRSGSRCPVSGLLLSCLLLLGIACGGGGSIGGGGGGGGTPPAPPTSLTATPISSSKINLGWFPSTGATSYTVYRSTTNGFTPSSSNQIASTNESSFYADSALSPSTTYYYVLKAANSSGLSSGSNQASASTQAFDPGTPAGTYNVTVTATSGPISHSVNLTLTVN